jgi:cyclic pyranopterin phosphate synthase
MSNHFCGGCNRLRITADGKLKVCLFGEEGLSLRDAFRNGATDEQVVSLIGHSVKGKKAVLGGHGTSTPEELATKSNRPMILIGG